ncbi:hypothetical protein [Streptomyces sp. NPDC006307]|uniref:hypothetical protein n=1 Tax=Streptomyces sp. NPDC006307 TaxID=3156748 RepID=UPI0033A15A36
MNATVLDGRVLGSFRQGRWRTSLDTVALPGATGTAPGTALALVPEIVAAADRRWWDTTGRRRLADFPRETRRTLLLRALDLFDGGTVTIGGLGAQSAGDFRTALWDVAGLPAPLVDRWCALLRARLLERRATAPPDDALALVSLPGNTFTCLESVLEEAERSGAVWIRPSRREPLSAARLLAALLAVGWPPERLGFYPAQPAVLHRLVTLTDRQTVYGDAEVAASVRASAALTLHGPGRACALLPGHLRGAAAADWLLPLVAGDSGRFCTNVRTVVCTDHAEEAAEETAEALAAALDAISPYPTDPALPLAATRDHRATDRVIRSVQERLRPGDRVVTRRPPTADSPAGDRYPLPRLVLAGGRVTGSRDVPPLAGYEAPFPFAVVVRATQAGAAAVAERALFVHRPDRSRTA